MTATHMKGHIKETTGKLTGDTQMQVEGTLEKGFADVKRVVGDDDTLEQVRKQLGEQNQENYGLKERKK